MDIALLRVTFPPLSQSLHVGQPLIKGNQSSPLYIFPVQAGLHRRFMHDELYVDTFSLIINDHPAFFICICTVIYEFFTNTDQKTEKKGFYCIFFNQTSIYSYTYGLFDIWKCIQLQPQRHTLLCHFVLN